MAHGIAKEVKWKSDGELEGPRLPSWIRKITRINNARGLNREGPIVLIAFVPRGGRDCEEKWEGGKVEKVEKVFPPAEPFCF